MYVIEVQLLHLQHTLIADICIWYLSHMWSPYAHVWGLAVKYWLRLENGTENAILSEAFFKTKSDNHNWTQSVQYM